MKLFYTFQDMRPNIVKRWLNWRNIEAAFQFWEAASFECVLVEFELLGRFPGQK